MAPALSGRVRAQHIVDLKELLKNRSDCRNLIVGLKEIELVDRLTVTCLSLCEAIEFRNCPAFLQKWVAQERFRAAAETAYRASDAIMDGGEH